MSSVSADERAAKESAKPSSPRLPLRPASAPPRPIQGHRAVPRYRPGYRILPDFLAHEQTQQRYREKHEANLRAGAKAQAKPRVVQCAGPPVLPTRFRCVAKSLPAPGSSAERPAFRADQPVRYRGEPSFATASISMSSHARPGLVNPPQLLPLLSASEILGPAHPRSDAVYVSSVESERRRHR